MFIGGLAAGWFLVHVWANVGWVVMGILPAGLMAGFAVFGAVEPALAGVVGAWLYRE